MPETDVEHERVAQPEINLGREREFETGKDESWAAHQLQVASDAHNLVANALKQMQQELATINSITLQAVQHAVENGNALAKQMIRHGDIAIDGQWNPVQQGAGDTLTARAVTIDDASLKAIGAVVAAAVADALSKK